MSNKTTTAKLIDEIAASTQQTKAEVARFLDGLSDAITNNLKEGKPVALGKLGTFKPSHRAARLGRNPKTGEALQIAASNSANFTASTALKTALN